MYKPTGQLISAARIFLLASIFAFCQFFVIVAPVAHAAEHPKLSVSPQSLVDPFSPFASAGCSYVTYGIGLYGHCPITLTNDSSTDPLTWTANVSDQLHAIPDTGYTLSETSGTIPPGQRQTLTFTANPVDCPDVVLMTFTTIHNTVQVPFKCTIIGVDPNALTFSQNACTRHNGMGDWKCIIHVFAYPNDPIPSHWTVNVQGSTTGVSIIPSGGVLDPGTSIRLVVRIPASSCPGSATFAFDTIGGGHTGNSTLNWSC